MTSVNQVKESIKTCALKQISFEYIEEYLRLYMNLGYGPWLASFVDDSALMVGSLARRSCVHLVGIMRGDELLSEFVVRVKGTIFHGSRCTTGLCKYWTKQTGHLWVMRGGFIRWCFVPLWVLFNNCRPFPGIIHFEVSGRRSPEAFDGMHPDAPSCSDTDDLTVWIKTYVVQ